MVRPNLARLEDTLMAAMARVYAVFRPHIDSLDLAPSERNLLDILSTNFSDSL